MDSPSPAEGLLDRIVNVRYSDGTMQSRAAQSARQAHNLEVAGAKPASAMESFLAERAAMTLCVERPGALSATEVLASACWFDAYRGINGPQPTA